MADISFGGLSTGLPTEEIISSLMAVERAPLDRLEADKESEAQRLEAYKQIDTLLDNLRSAAGGLNLTSEVRTTSVRLSSGSTIDAVPSGAAEGSYDIAVAQLAQVQKSVTDGFDSLTDSVLGTGPFTIGDTTIDIDESNNSLQGLMASINAVSAETGVNASIINDGNDSGNYHLVFTGQDAATSFTVDHDLTDSDSSPISFATSEVRSAQQAIAYIDGIEIVSNSNSISGAISGLTINLNEVSDVISSDPDPTEYVTTTLNVEADTEALKEKISGFVTSYNEIMSWISSGYEGSGSSTTDSGEAESDEASLSHLLRGDATINDIKRSLQNILSDAVDTGGSMQILSQLGIATQKDGTLHLNSSQLDSALTTNFEDTVHLLAGKGEVDGVMKKFNSYLLDVTSVSQGMYAEKTARHDTAIKRLDSQIDVKELMMSKIETRIRNQFTAMELLVGNLNAQGDYLTQQMDMLSNLSSGKS